MLACPYLCVKGHAPAQGMKFSASGSGPTPPFARTSLWSIGRLADELIVHPEVVENHVARTVTHRHAYVDPFVEDDFDYNVAAWGDATPGVLSERVRELDLPPTGDGVLSLITGSATKETGSDRIGKIR